jgi:hypothetical protein
MIKWLDRNVLLAVAASLMLGLAGCEVFNGDDADDDVVLRDERISYPADPAPGRPTPSTYNPRVPDSAILMNQWINNELEFRPNSPGTIYILDENNELVYSGRIDDSELFRFDRRAGEVTIDDRLVFSRAMPGVQKYRVFFDRR